MLYNYNTQTVDHKRSAAINQSTLKSLSLFRSNYKAAFYLREIAREVEVDVKAVSIQLSRLEQANIIVSTQKGKNKEYSLNLGNCLTKYYLVLAETYTTIEFLSNNFEIKKLVEETADNLGKTAVLFGSFVKKSATQESDIDIIIVDDKKPNLDAFKDVSSLLNRKVSIKPMHEQQFSKGLSRLDPLVMEVVANHITLKGIDNLCNMLWRYYAK